MTAAPVASPLATTSSAPFTITPSLSAEKARAVAAGLDLRSPPPEFYANPYPVYAALREHEPVRRMPDGSVLITRHADSVQVYKDAATFSSDKKVEFAPKYAAAPHLYEHHTTSLIFNDPPLHTEVRKIIMGAMHRRAIDLMEGGLVELTGRLADQIAAKGGGCLIEDFAAAIPIEVIGNLLCIPQDERGPLRDWSLAILGALEPKISPEQAERGNRAVAEFLDYLRVLVAKRRVQLGDPHTDVLTRLIQSERSDEGHKGEPLTEQELLHNCIFLLNAGHETTTNLIGNALVALQEWPEEKVALIGRIQTFEGQPEKLNDVLNAAVDEFLRFESSNQLGNRRVVKDAVVGGVPLAAGTLITLCIGAANRDPAVFTEPERMNLARTLDVAALDVTVLEVGVLEAGDSGLAMSLRDGGSGAAGTSTTVAASARPEPSRHLSFAFGIHQCAGLHLARLEGRVALQIFLQRFPHYRLSAPPVRGGRARFRGFLSAPFTV